MSTVPDFRLVPLDDPRHEEVWALAASMNAAPSCTLDEPIGGMLRSPNLLWVGGFVNDVVVASVALMVGAEDCTIVVASITPEYGDAYTTMIWKALVLADLGPRAVRANLQSPAPGILDLWLQVFGESAEVVVDGGVSRASAMLGADGAPGGVM